ncbi:hypothetical protein PQU96_05745 [Vogesella sp. LYT5W]|uniref:Alcohol dehydrogenase n=1 Tax=Vogesella margarita TaxID=2984199 RepID=A0ABT5IMA0_9NEIS|nr:hypothetical protein [Vogesella margarita]MDC7713642.1 hypothetical protein [Vogesella margarita]
MVRHAINGMAPQLWGAGTPPLNRSSGYMEGRERSVQGSFNDTPHENEKTLAFSVLADIRPQIETLPLEQANEAYQRLLQGDGKFRMVLEC